MSNKELDKLIDEISDRASYLGLDLNQLIECLNEAVVEDGKQFAGAGQKEGPGVPPVNFTETKDEDDDDLLNLTASVSNVTLQPSDVDNLGITTDDFGKVTGGETEDLLGISEFDPYATTTTATNNDNNNNNDEEDDLLNLFTFGKKSFGKKIISKATESVRQIAKKKGIYIVGRKGKKFLGIRFTKKGNYGKNKKGRPNGKMYTYDGLKKMKNKRVSFKKLPELIDMMNTKAVLKKYKNFKFGFELGKQPRGCSGFGYTFPVGAGYGKRSALLYGKL